MDVRSIVDSLKLVNRISEFQWSNFIVKLLPRGRIWNHIYRSVGGLVDTISTGGYSHNDNVPGGGTSWQDNISTAASGKTSKFSIFLSVFAAEFSRFWSRKTVLENEMVPGNAVELLEDYETILGLPDECTPDVPLTLQERQNLVHQKWTQGKTNPDLEEITQSESYYIEYAANLGYTITITYGGGPFRIGDRVGGRLGTVGDLYTWNISGDYDAFLQCLFERDKPAYTIINWI